MNQPKRYFPNSPRPRAACVIAIACGCWLFLHGTAEAQFGPPSAPLTMTRDRDAEAWLRKATDAIAREDWKLLADALHRVTSEFGNCAVGDPEVALDDTDATVTTARVRAWRLLRSCPPSALEAYRLIYEIDAERALNAAIDRGDSDSLRDVMTRYLPTRSGARATELLAARLIDAGHFYHALRVLDALEMFPDHGAPAWRIPTARCIASLAIGDRAAALRHRDALRARHADALPDDGIDRPALLDHLLTDSASMARIDAPRDWPRMLGRPEQRGRMASVTPDLSHDNAIRVELPHGVGIDAEVAEIHALELGLPPVWQMVTDGRLIVVSTPAGFAAFDPVTLAFRGEPYTSDIKAQREKRVPQPEAAFAARSTRRGRRMRFDAPDADTTQALIDQPAGSVAIVNGVVFLVEQAMQTDPNNQAIAAIEPNTLGAYDAVTLKRLWRKGRGGHIGEGLGEARFYSLPVAVGEDFVTLISLGSDLSLVVIDRAGRTKRMTPLGHSEQESFPDALLALTEADGEIYVQTGMGRIIAVDARDCSIVWVSRYASHPMDWSDAWPSHWLGGPMIVAGDRLIVAPVDSEYLMAIDRRSGAVLWRAPRMNGRYLIGADESQVYTGGIDVSAFPLAPAGTEPGRPESIDAAPVMIAAAWTVPQVGATGRAVLAEDRIIVPVQAGLRMLQRDGTEIVHLFDPTDPAPPGNLYVWNDALYSIEFNAIRRFGDVHRELAQARSGFEAAPDNLEARLRLARVHLRLDQPGAALTALDTPFSSPLPAIEPAGALASATEEMDHLRTEAIRAITTAALRARPDDFDADHLSGLLDRATRLATRPRDRLDVSLLRSRVRAQRDDAAGALVELTRLLTDVGGAYVAVDYRYRVGADVLIGGRMAEIWRDMSDAQRDAALGALRDAARPALNADDPDLLRRVGDAMGFCEVGLDADLHMARRERENDLPDSAEFYLRRVLARHPDDQRRLAATTQLVELLCSPPNGAPPRWKAARRLIDALRAPASTMPGDESAWGERAGRAGGAAADALARRVDAARAQQDLDSTSRDAIDWSLGLREVARARNAGEGSHFFIAESDDDADRWGINVAVTSDTLTGMDVNRAAPDARLWTTPVFSMPGDELQQDAADMPIRRSMRGRALPASSAICGSIAAIPTGRGVLLTGLTTGQYMCRAIAIAEDRIGDMPERGVASAGGMFAIATTPNTVVGLRARNDASPCWRRTMDTSRLAWIAEAGGRFVACDRQGHTVWVLDAATGRRHATIPVVGTDQAAELRRQVSDRGAHLALVGDHLASFVGDALTVRHVAGNVTVWTDRTPQTPIDIRRLDHERFAVCTADHVYVYDCGDRRRIGEALLTDVDMPPIDMVLEGDHTLIVQAGTTEESPRHRLVWYSLRDGQPLDGATSSGWDYALVTPGMLRAADVIPVIGMTRGGNHPTGLIGRTQLFLFDRATGARLGPPVDMSDSDGTSVVNIVDVAVGRRRLQVMRTNERILFEAEDPAP